MLQEVKKWGATPDDWFHFSIVLGLESDLLPLISNPEAAISASSSLKSIGKTPSVYNRDRKVIGFADWTVHRATSADIERWSKEPDFGICLIARVIKGIDVDISDPLLAQAVEDFILAHLQLQLPKRFRDNSPKYLLAFRCEAETTKRVIRTPGGVIEFLGNWQQFVVCGTHTSGARYEWQYLTDEIPTLTLEQFDALWLALHKRFASEPGLIDRPRREVPEVDAEEPVLRKLIEKGMVLGGGRDMSINIECPFAHEHTTEGVESSTVYWPAHTGGFASPAIKCLHAHCSGRTMDQYKDALGISALDDFEVIPDGVEDEAEAPKPGMFKPIVLGHDYAQDGEAPKWLVKSVIPESGVGFFYGPSGSGKSFLVFDLFAAVVRGLPWRGHKVKQGMVIYIVAEGSLFFKNRIRAYMQHHDLTELPIGILPDNPNLMKREHVLGLIAQIEALGIPIAAVVIDTFAACMLGDENSGLDVGKVLSNCKALQKRLNCVVALVHHAGKDASRGARGHSRLYADVDFQYQVVREGDKHALVCTKQKDGNAGSSYGFKLTKINLGSDEDGDPVDSCVITETDEMPLVDANAPRGTKIGEREASLYNTAQDMFEEDDAWPEKDKLVEHTKNLHGYREADLRRSLEKLIELDKLIEMTDGTVRVPG